jgi:hypothetical protein
LKIKITGWYIAGVIGIISLIFFTMLFGLSGIRVLIAFSLLYLIPVYYIVDALKIEMEEKLIVTPFLSLGIVPSLTYYIGLALGSLVWAIVITFCILSSTALYLQYYVKQKN